MATIHVENLSAEYRRKLCAGELTRETIERLASSISRQYLQRKRVFHWLVFLLPAMTVLMTALSAFAPAAQKGSMTVLWGATAFTVAAEFLILAVVYRLAVTRVPGQFARCLKKGYPELEMEYGYEQLTNGSLAGTIKKGPSFSLLIEDTFRLKDSEDLIVAGFAHGLIEQGNSAFVDAGNDAENDAGQKPLCVIVAALEKAGGKSARQAADCRVALRIQKGAALGLAPGMRLYRR